MQVGRNGRAGMSANRGKFVSNIAALRPTDAPATPGRSVDGFEGVLRRGHCPRPGGCSHRGGGLFCVAAREAGRDGGKAGGAAWAGMSASRGKFVSSISALRLTDALATPGRAVDGFEGVFASWALSALRGLFPSRGRAFLRGGARSVAERWQSGQNGWGQACLRGGARQL